MPDKSPSIDFGEIERNLRKMAARVPGAEDRLIGLALMAGVKLVQDRTPVDTGALKAANAAKWHGGQQPPGTVAEGESPEHFPLEARSGEGYLYNSMSYAASVHEDLDAYHDVGQAKYIERALPELGEELIRRLADDLMKEIAP